MNGSSASVSVIIPCFRCQLTLQRALASLEEQTLPPSEIIIINDGNSQCIRREIVAICSESALADKISLVHLSAQQGPSVARNTGWGMATQDYIAFLDADDSWHPQKIEVQYQLMRRNPDIAISGHAIVRDKAFKNRSTPHDRIPVRWVKPARGLIINEFRTSSVMLQKSIPLRFHPEKIYSEDYLLWLEILHCGFRGVYINSPLAFVYKNFFGGEGLSGNLWRMEKGELDTYVKLYKSGYIPISVLYGLIFLSLLKYLRRYIVCKLALR